MTREEALEKLLEPIPIQDGDPIGKARVLLLRSCEKVKLVLPFLDKGERKRANEWLEESKRFDYLWD